MIVVTGATGFLGRRVCRMLDVKGIKHTKTSLSSGLDLRDRKATMEYFEEVNPKSIINCASFVGGIQFGLKHPVKLFENNMLMTLNLLAAAEKHKVKRIVNPISNCAYPGSATLFKESEFWDGPLHESVLVYGFVRKASWIGSWAYAQEYGLDVVNLILSNMYGPEDHFEEERSHALGALIMKFVEAKRSHKEYVSVWGTGKPVREWLHVDDGAEAMIRALQIQPVLEPVNIGVAEGISIIDMAELIRDLVGYTGEIRLETSKPDGAMYKTVDGTKGEGLLGWKPKIPFLAGVKSTIEWYEENFGKTNK